MVNWVPKYAPKPAVHQQGSSFAQEGMNQENKIECWGCGKADVVLSSCTNPACVTKWKNKQARRQERQGEQHLNVDDSSDDDSHTDDWEDDDSFDIGKFQGYQFHQEKNPTRKVDEECILLDNQSTHDTFYNPKLLRNIKEAKGSVVIHTNGGSITYDKTGVLPGYGTVWFNPDGIANILSLARVENKGHTVECTQGKFTVTNKRTKNVSVFRKHDHGLFVLDTRTQKDGGSFVQTVKENMEIYTGRQVAKAKAARDLYAMIGRPSLDDYIGIIRNRLLPNAKIHVEDITNAEHIFGKDLGAIQGKTTRTQPGPVITNYVDLPPDLYMAHQKVTLCMDVMHVNAIPFFVSVSRRIQFTTAEKLNNRKAASVADRGRDQAGGVSPTLSPQTIVTGIAVDHDKHCRIPFGGYAQVHAHPNPTNVAMESRTVGGISLGPSGNVQGSYYFLSLLTGKRIKARSFTSLPMPSEVIKQVESFAKDDEEGITFQDRQGREGWMVEVDAEEEYHDANEYIPEAEGRDIQLRVDDQIGHDEVQDLQDDQEVFQDAVEEHPPEELAEDGQDGEGIETPGVELDETPGVESEEEQETPGVGDPPQTPESVGSAYELGQNPAYGDMRPPEEEVVFESPSQSGDSAESEDESYVQESDHESESMDDENESSKDEEDRVRATTQRGRKIRLNRHLFDNYQFFGRAKTRSQMMRGNPIAKREIAPDAYTPSVQCSLGDNPRSGHHPCPGFDGVLGLAFTQYSLKQGLRRFPDEASQATMDEMKQLHEKHTFQPCHPDEMTEQEKKDAIGSLIFIKHKRCGRVKARACADGRPQRLIYDKHEASSPTVKTESVLLSCVQDAEEGRDVAITDIPGAFLNARLEERVHMRLVGAMADLLIAAVPGVYEMFATKDERGQTVLYVLLTRALYGCLKSALQFWKHLSGNLLEMGYVLNPYDTCVANKEIDGNQCTITWHVDDLKVSHKDPKVVDAEIEQLEKIYGKMVTTRGKEHTYLGMDVDYSVPGEVAISMIPYMTEIIEEFPDEIPKGAGTPAAAHLFEENGKAPPLDKRRAKVFHHTVAKILWASMRARPDLLTAISFLTSKVQEPDEDDYKKLLRLLSYIKETLDLKLILSSDGTAILKWWTDASFATRADYKSQTGATMSMGKGSIYSMARKQKLNTKSSTEAELVGADDILPQMAWTKNFMEAQGWGVTKNILFQDNQSAMLLEKNGTGSSSRRTRHINIKFFFIKDRIANGDLDVEYCPTDEMVGDFFTKPLQGQKFLKFRAIIMGEKS